MSNYRRLYIPGGNYFFTLVSYHRQAIFADPEQVELLRQAFKEVKAKRPFELTAIVILPDHLHCLWRLPNNDCDFSRRWQMIKTAFSRRIPSRIKHDGSKTIWQPRFYEHCIRDEQDFYRHLDYIHYNPVKHGLVSAPGSWLHSSFNRFVEKGWYESSWGYTRPANIENLELD